MMGSREESQDHNKASDQLGPYYFKGAFPLDFGGGFASVRYVFETLEAGNYNGFQIMLKGEWKNISTSDAATETV